MPTQAEVPPVRGQTERQRLEGHVAQLERQLGECRQAQAALECYRVLFEEARDILLFVAEESGRILEANAAAIRACGYTRREMLSLTIHDLRAPETKPDVAAQMAKAAATGILFETVHRRKDGSTFPAKVGARDALWDRHPVLLGVIRAITARRLVEAAHARATAELEAAFRALPDLYFRLDSDGRILDYRAATVEHLYVPRGAFLGRHLADDLPPRLAYRCGRRSARSSARAPS